MNKKPFPDKFEKERYEFNSLARENQLYYEAAQRELTPQQRAEFDTIEEERRRACAQVDAENKLYREKHIQEEIDKIIRTPSLKRDGPAPVIGGRRQDKPASVERIPLTDEEFQNVRALAAKNVDKADEDRLTLAARPSIEHQRNLIDRALKENRGLSRSGR